MVEGRGEGRLCRLFVLCRVAAISHTSSAASGLASELTPSSSPTSPATHPATHATLSVEILRILESRMEKRTSLRQKKRNREKERERERVSEAWCAVISSGLLFPLWGAVLTTFTEMPLIFLKGIGSDGYSSRWGARVFRDTFGRDFSLKRLAMSAIVFSFLFFSFFLQNGE